MWEENAPKIYSWLRPFTSHIIECISVANDVVLDEATSQVGVAMERQLYSMCSQLNITVLSVGHRDSLREFHQIELHIGDTGSWQLRPIDSGASNDQIAIDIDSV